MTNGPLYRVVEHLKAAVPQEGDWRTDGRLLEAFVQEREEAAFAALVRRHGPLVWGVCLRVARDHHDAEDAFQATFLVLARKAASVRPREMVANWLYGVAHRTALKTRAVADRRRGRERQVMAMPEPVRERSQWDDLLPLLDLELSRLPDKYRGVIVLCDLEGKTRREVARQLGLPEGTVASRLATARTMLAKRLARQGATVSGGALATVLAGNAAPAGVPAALVVSTIEAATTVAVGTAAGLVSARVAALTEGVLKTMMLSKLKIAVGVVLAVSAVGIGAGGMFRASLSAQPPASDNAPAKPEVPAKEPPADAKPLLGDAQPDNIPEKKNSPPLLLRRSPDAPPTADDLRVRYLKLHEELSRHLTAAQVKEQVDRLEKQVADAKAREERAERERKAAEELDKVKVALQQIAKTYPDTAAGRKARVALEAANAKPLAVDTAYPNPRPLADPVFSNAPAKP